MIRRRAAAVAAGIFGLLAACGVAGDPGHAAAGAGKEQAQAKAGGCGEVGLASPGPAAMPVPDRVRAPETFPEATVTLTPPGPEDVPSLPAERAWDAALVAKRAGIRYELVLARMSAEFPATMVAGAITTPLYQGVLVWVVVTHAIPMVSAGGSSVAATLASPRPSCFLADELDVTDATTGRFLLSSAFGTTG